MRTRLPFLALLFVPLACGGSDPDASSAETAEPALDAPECSWNAEGDELAERESPPAETSVRLAGDQMRVCYSRPHARGRDIMGDLVPFGEPWRTGANEPTRVHVTFPASIAGVEVEPGSYSLYTVPAEGEWTVALNRQTDRWGIPIPTDSDVGRGTVAADATDEMVEALTIELEATGERTADMVLEWENTRIRIPVRRIED